MNPARHLVTAVLAAVAAVSLSTAPARAQVSGRSARLSPTASIGTGVLEFDPSDDRAFQGYAMRAGLQLNRFLDVTTAGQYWADLQGLRGRAIHLEGLFYPLGRPPVAPYVVFGIGHFAVSPGPGSSRSPFAGRATAFGLGLHGRVRGAWGLRIEGLVRIDALALDDELRGFLTYAPPMQSPASSLPAPQVTAAAYWMAPLAGPWRFVEPGYGLKFATPLSPQAAASLTLALVHWRIPSSFDTRAVLLLPGFRRRLEHGGRLYVQGGPLLSVMVEGPDEGTRGGLHLEIGGRAGAGRLSATGGLGWMWLSRSPDPVYGASTGADEHGVLAHIGLTF